MALAAGLLLAACNLGPQAASGPLTATPPLVVPQGAGDQLVQATETPLIQIPPTNTPVPELLPSEKIGPISVDGTTHRGQELGTVHVTRGTAVSNPTCGEVTQDVKQAGAHDAPKTTPFDGNTGDNVYTFTPAAAGTYAVNCTGIAVTASGQRAINAAGTPFAVEAKG